MLDAEMARLKQDLALLDRHHPDVHWTKTPIQNYSTLVSDVRRMWADQWWERPQNSVGAAISHLLAKYERARDGQEEPDENARARQQRAAEGHGAGRENVEVDKEEEKTTGHDEGEYAEYFPEPEDNAWAWADALATKVDMNTPESRPWYSALLSYVHKFPQKTKASDLDQETVAKLVKKICDGGHHDE